jgi:hypothetical protein
MDFSICSDFGKGIQIGRSIILTILAYNDEHLNLPKILKA